MTRSQRTLALVLGAVASVPAVFLVASAYFDAMVRSEYASGARTSTDGDSIFIPVMGVALAWVVLLLGAAAVTGIVLIFRRARRSTD
jgi:hypothetical protein